MLSTASDDSAARITAVSNGANNRNLELRTLASGSAVTAMTLDSSGRLLLGATGVTYADADADNLLIGDGSTANRGLTIATSNTNTATIAFSDGTGASQQKNGSIVYDHSNASMQFTSNNSERIRIDSSGDVAIGTTTATYRLTVEDSSADWASRIYNTGTGASNLRIVTGKQYEYVQNC